MPDSQVQLANAALQLVGAAAIAALEEDTEQARLINRCYVPLLDARLRDGDWNFAVRRVALAQLATAPAYGYSYQYQLPQDPYCLRVLDTNLDDDEPYEIETVVVDSDGGSATYRVILSNQGSVSIRYLARITDPTLMDPLFAHAFKYDLAFEVAYPISRNAQLQANLAEERKSAWQRARSRDGQEGRKRKTWLSESFTQVR